MVYSSTYNITIRSFIDLIERRCNVLKHSIYTEVVWYWTHDASVISIRRLMTCLNSTYSFINVKHSVVLIMRIVEQFSDTAVIKMPSKSIRIHLCQSFLLQSVRVLFIFLYDFFLIVVSTKLGSFEFACAKHLRNEYPWGFVCLHLYCR